VKLRIVTYPEAAYEEGPRDGATSLIGRKGRGRHPRHPSLTDKTSALIDENALPDYLEADVGCSAHSNGASSAAAEIDRGAVTERTTIIDANDHRSAIMSVRDTNPRSEAERPVRCGHRARIEPFSGRGSVSCKLSTVIRRNLCLSGGLYTYKCTKGQQSRPHCKSPLMFRS
jgi:hypothetical protein